MPVVGVDPWKEGIQGSRSILFEEPFESIARRVGLHPLPGLLYRRIRVNLHRVKQMCGVHEEVFAYSVWTGERINHFLGMESRSFALIEVSDYLRGQLGVLLETHHTGIIARIARIPSKGEVFIEERSHGLDHEYIRVDVDSSIVIESHKTNEITHCGKIEVLVG